MARNEDKRGMDAVITKSSGQGRRKAAMRRKGAHALAIMIAMGGPKGGPQKGPKGPMMDDDAPEPKQRSKAERIAAIEQQIGALKAELALLEGEDDDMEDDSEEESDAMDEDED